MKAQGTFSLTSEQRPMLRFLIVQTTASVVGLQCWMILFNNFAVEVAGLDGFHIGFVGSVLEIPGLLALLDVSGGWNSDCRGSAMLVINPRKGSFYATSSV